MFYLVVFFQDIQYILLILEKYKNEPFSGLRIIHSGSVVLFNALYSKFVLKFYALLQKKKKMEEKWQQNVWNMWFIVNVRKFHYIWHNCNKNDANIVYLVFIHNSLIYFLNRIPFNKTHTNFWHFYNEEKRLSKCRYVITLFVVFFENKQFTYTK